MCTITKECPVLQTAEQDIFVYKTVFPIQNVFGNILCITSLHFDFEYPINEIVHSELDEFYFANCGYVSGRAFYSYKYKGAKDVFRANALFIIPKGAKYYLCKDIDSGDYIYHSNQIKLIKLL